MKQPLRAGLLLAILMLWAYQVMAAPAPPAPAPPPPPPPPPPAPTVDRELLIGQASAALARIQSYIEFFYMSTGTYPQTLQQLNEQFNQNLKPNQPKLEFPNDPASGKPFVYDPAGDGLSYVLRVPDATMYGMKKLEISNVPWAHMTRIPQEARRRALVDLCSYYVQGLAKVLETYARDNKNQLPDKLDDLVAKKAIKQMPSCPACDKPYAYTKDARGFTVGCPQPSSHQLEMIRYSSTEGFKIR